MPTTTKNRHPVDELADIKHATGKFRSGLAIFGTQCGPILGSVFGPFWAHFGAVFSAILGPALGPFWA